MDAERVKEGAIRYRLLLLISIALVAGFWFHAEFYQIGLYPLLLLGGFATFLVIVALRALGSGRIRPMKPRGDVPFSRDATGRVLAGTQTLAILPIAATVPPAGAAANAVVAPTGQPFARIHIRDVRRRLLVDVRDEDAVAAGFDDAEDLRRAWSQDRKWDRRDIVLLVSFRKEAGA